MSLRPLTLEDFTSPTPRLQIEAVEIKELGGTVHVREMDNEEGDAWEAAEHGRDTAATKAADGDEDAGLKARMHGFATRLLRATLCQPDGTLFFKPGDGKPLKLGRLALARLFAVAKRLNVITDKDVQELLGKVKGAPGGASGTN